MIRLCFSRPDNERVRHGGKNHGPILDPVYGGLGAGRGYGHNDIHIFCQEFIQDGTYRRQIAVCIFKKKPAGFTVPVADPSHFPFEAVPGYIEQAMVAYLKKTDLRHL